VLSSSSAAARRLNTVMLTTAHSQKVPQMLTAWRERDIGNLTVVVEHTEAEPALARLRLRLRNEGLSWIATRRSPAKQRGSGTGSAVRAANQRTELLPIT
jgi:hypothetical protein